MSNNNLWLKALTCFTLTEFPAVSAQELDNVLAAQRFVPCGELDRESHGFTDVFGKEGLVRETQGVFWLQLKSEKKIVPGAVVKRKLAERVAKIEKEEARKVGKKEKKDLKEMVIDELVAKAMSTESVVTVMIDPAGGHLLVNSASNKTAELVMTYLLKCIDGLSYARTEFGTDLSKAMSDLLLDPDTSEFTTDSSLVLKGPGSPASTVRFAQHGLASSEIANHLNAGLRPVALELGYKDRMSFILTNPFTIKKLTFLELVQTQLENANAEDPDELTNAILLIQVGELRAILAALVEWLGLPSKDGKAAEQEAAQ